MTSPFDDLDDIPRTHLTKALEATAVHDEIAANMPSLAAQLDHAIGGDAAPPHLRQAVHSALETLGGQSQDIASTARASLHHIADIARAEQASGEDPSGTDAGETA
ncbi:hypothetical protein [Saccharopolyspora griseoalba]|uniref:Uncharacterized protein n=1 Tax=Saccharopolyspora griseoalba TaxID=1431848 RepID=A0ABW2LTH3_9PSEU